MSTDSNRAGQEMTDTNAHLTPTDIHPWVAAGIGKVRFGISIFPHPVDWRQFIDVVQRAEADGMDSYWSYDHPQSRVDCWTALSALAASTSTIRLGTAMNCIYYRSPYMLARQAADVDRLSNGRLILGLGIGDNVPEFRRMGLEFPDTRTRMQGMVETIKIVRGLWSGESFSYEGEQWTAHADDTMPFLGPVQQPRVPIMIAGGGEKVTLRQVAKYADASNMGAHEWIGNATTSADIDRKFGKLQDYLAEFGRPADSICRSQFTMPLVMAESQAELDRKLAGMDQAVLEWCGDALFAGTPDETIAFYRDLQAAGFQYFIANILDGDYSTIELMGKHLIPAFR